MIKFRNIIKKQFNIINCILFTLLLTYTATSAFAQQKSKTPQLDEYGNQITVTDRNQYNGMDYNGTVTTPITPNNDVAERNSYKGMDYNGTITDVNNVGKLYDDKYKNQCSLETLKKQYMENSDKNCWYCNIVSTMTGAYLEAVANIMNIVENLALLILHYGFLIWLAYYILQQVSSLAPITPGKMLQEILMMGFKVLLATLAVRQGISLLTEFFLDPVMLFGIDYGQTMLNGVMEKEVLGGAS